LAEFPERFDSMTAAPTAVGAAVAVALFAMALARSWKPEPAWIDRTGRFLGCIAIGMALIGVVVHRI
jgi:hypothetical protein